MGQLQSQIVPFDSHQVRVEEQLGEGGYAFVYRVQDVNTGEKFAMKRILGQSPEQIRMAQKEVAVMKRVSPHPHIVEFLGACQRKAEKNVMEFYVLMELCSGGSMADLVITRSKTNNFLEENKICEAFLHACKAVQCLHSNAPPIAHRDLKIENLLYSTKHRAWKLCDFGSCTTRAKSYDDKTDRSREEEEVQKNSTVMYRAPEMVDLHAGHVVNEKVDIWALGCILYTIAFFVHPFQEGSTLQIMGGKYEIPEEHIYSKTMLKIIKKCLTVNPKKRPSIDQVLEMVADWQSDLGLPSLSATSSASSSKPAKSSKVSTSSSDKEKDSSSSKSRRRAGEEPSEDADENPFAPVESKSKPKASPSSSSKQTASSKSDSSKKPSTAAVSSSNPTNLDDDWDPFGEFQSADSSNGQKKAAKSDNSDEFSFFSSAQPSNPPANPSSSSKPSKSKSTSSSRKKEEPEPDPFAGIAAALSAPQPAARRTDYHQQLSSAFSHSGAHAANDDDWADSDFVGANHK